MSTWPFPKRTKRIEVTQADIDTGTPARGDDCPVKRAIRRVVIPEVVVTVSPLSAYLKMAGPTPRRIVIWLPREVADFIQAFDHRENPSPIEFDLDLPTEALRPEEQPQP